LGHGIRPTCKQVERDSGSPAIARREHRGVGSTATHRVSQGHRGRCLLHPLSVRGCGTNLDLPLVAEPPGIEGLVVATTNAVVLFPSCQSACSPPVGSGVFLPSLRPFTFDVSSGVGLSGSPPPVAYLGPRHIYLLDTQSARLWAAPFPSKPPDLAKH
jgi:hypothetical protein